MAHLRVPAVIYREIAELTTPRGAVKRGGIMQVPKQLRLDEWEALAGPYQDALIASATEDRRLNADPPRAPYVDPNIEHNKWNRAQWEQTQRGAKDYLAAKTEAVKRVKRQTVVR